MRTTLHSLLFLLLVHLPARADEPPPEAVKIAEAAGLEAFGKLERVSFTFNAKVGDVRVIRDWFWYPKKDQFQAASVIGAVGVPDKPGTPTPPEPSESEKAEFINDQYWLTFPFHLLWDKDVSFEVAPEKVEGPLTKKPLGKLTVQYPKGVGFTPGDAYDLYYDDEHLIREWVYRKGGAAEPTRQSTWQDYQDFDGWKIATNHEGPDGFRVWFTDIQVK